MPKSARRIQFIADRGDARLRLDQILVRRVTEITRMSRSRAQQWIEDGAVSVNGRAATRPAIHVTEGATVEIALPESAERRAQPQPENTPLDILYEDEHLIAINKPAGMVVHPSYKNVSGTILNAVLHRLRDRGSVRPGIVTRLDRETSGLLLVALTAGVHARLQRDGLDKEYLAIVSGAPKQPHGTIDLPLGRDPNDRRRMIVARDGLPSITNYEAIARSPEGLRYTLARSPEGRSPKGRRYGHTLIRCELVTGRTHQIRVHLAAIGLPIVGDAMYGVLHPGIGRVALHSWRVRLRHPVSGEPIEITAPLPDDMETLRRATTSQP